MGTIDIEGIGPVTVSDDFGKLSAEQQQQTANDIARQINAARAKNVAADIQKPPDYGSMSAGQVAKEAVSNIPSSAARFAGDIYQAVRHPVQTATNLKNIGLGVLEKIQDQYPDTGTPLTRGHQQYAEAVGQFLVDRYGSGAAIKKALATDPVGVAADVATLLTGGELAAARAPGIAGTLGRAAGTVGRAIDPINVAGKVVQGGRYAVDAASGGALTAQTTARADVARALARDQITPEHAQKLAQALGNDTSLPRVQAAAVKLANGKILTGPSHLDIVDKLDFDDLRGAEDGFVTNTGRFVDRDEASRIANYTGNLRFESSKIKSAAGVTGRNPTLADVGGENTRGLMERVAQTPGAGVTIVKPFLEGRQQQQAARIAGDLSELTGSRRTAFQAVSQTVADRAAAAQPLYQAALQAGDREIWSPGLERLTSSPTVRSAMQGAVRIWRDNAVADGFGAMNPGATVERGGLLRFQPGQVPVFPNLQFWDYTKRLIDDKISAAQRAGQNQKVRTLTQLVGNLRTELDRAVPQYAAARQAWAGPSAYLDAIETGRGILNRNMSAEEFTANFNALSRVEQDAVREGAVSSIVGRMGSDPAKLGDMTKLLRSPDMRAKIAAIMPTPEARATWNSRLNYEIRSSELAQTGLGGSATARRLAQQNDAKKILGDLSLDLISGNAGGIIKRLVVNKVRDTLRSKTDKEIARIMTSPAALQSLPTALSGQVLGRPPVLLKQPPYRAIGQSAFQAGRLSDQSQ